jgi:tetratricopeptide (TPR) repeat protein
MPALLDSSRNYRCTVIACIGIYLSVVLCCASGRSTTPGTKAGEPSADAKLKAEEEYSIGYEYMKQTRFAEAVPHFQNAIEFWPDYYGAYIALAQAYRSQGDFPGAESTYARAKRIDPADTRAYEGMGVLYFSDLKKYSEALTEYNAALVLDSTNVNILNSIASIYAVMKDYDNALAFYDRSLFYEPENISSSFAVAKLYIEKGEPEKAVSYLETLKAKKPEISDIRKQLGEVYLQMKNYEEAAREYEWLLVKYPDNAYYHLQLGFTLQKQGKYQAALKEYEEAHRLAPGDASALYYLVDLNIVRGKYTEAEARAREALAFVSDSSYAQILLGDIYERKGYNAKLAWEKKKTRDNSPPGISAVDLLDQAIAYYSQGKNNGPYASYASAEIDRCGNWVKQIKEELWYIGVKP